MTFAVFNLVGGGGGYSRELPGRELHTKCELLKTTETRHRQMLCNKKQPSVAVFNLVGVERFELPNDGIRIRGLTAWRHPKTKVLYHNYKKCQKKYFYFYRCNLIIKICLYYVTLNFDIILTLYVYVI